MIKEFTTLCCLICLSSFALQAQRFKADTLFLTIATANEKKIYTGAIRSQSQLYNGRDFKIYQPLDDEHPYLFSDDWITGTVKYDGNWYENVPMQYDIQNDELIIEYYNGVRSINLLKIKVSHFTLEQYKFILMKDQPLNYGYYEVLYDGNLKAYARHSKTLQENISGDRINRSFSERTKYYLFVNNGYHSITSKKSLIKLLADKKKELNQYANKNKLRFRENKTAFITRLAEQYDK